MNLFKIIGGVLIVTGFVFRMICVAYFKLKFRSVAVGSPTYRRLDGQRKRALLIDFAVIAMGFMTLVSH